MGRDGARGMATLRAGGAHTIAQNAATCVVYGMPRVAIELGGAAEVRPLDRIADAILAATGGGPPPDRRVATGAARAMSR